MLEIRQVETQDDVRHVQELIAEYSTWVQREVDKVPDLSSIPSFSDHEAEFATLPGIYGPPDGRLLLAAYDGALAGCGALKRINGISCELKRMYVRPAFRGKGIGGKLLETLIADARNMGYQTIYLDTHVDLKAAQRLYAAYGFAPSEGFYPVPEAFVPVTVFMKLDLFG